MSESKNKISLTGVEIPLILAIIALFFWNSPVLLPVKLITVFFHELSHGLMAIITGGKITEITLKFNQGGTTHFYGGWSFFVASAGYLGSLLWGSGILLASLKKGINKGLTISLGILMLLVSLLWIRTLESLAITITTAAALIFIAYKLKEEYCSIIIKFISFTSCFYVIYDIKDDLIDRTVPNSDAYHLSKMIFPNFMVSQGSYVIGLIWLAIAIFVIWKVFKIALKK